MGIKGLTKLLAEHTPRAAAQRRVEDYRGRVIAIDASLSIYQFLIVVGRKGTEVLTNEAGEVTSHLQGMLNRTVRLLEAGIKPVFVFDGEPPDLKKKKLAKRYTVPEDWPYQEVRTLFKEPNVCTEIPDFLWTSPDKEGLVNFLATENSFIPDRVEKAVEKIKAARDRYSPGRAKLLTPVANLPGSITGKEPKCVLGASGQDLKGRSALQVCKSSTSDFSHGSSKPLTLGRQSGFHGIPHAFSFI